MKRTLKLVSLVLSLVMLLATAVMTVSSADGTEPEYEQYQRVTKIATLEDSLFSASEELFAIDNVIYNGNGKKVNEIPFLTDNGEVNVIAYLDGKYAYTVYADVYHDEGWYSIQLFDATTGKVIADYDKNFDSDWANGAYSVGGKLYIDGALVKSYASAGVACLGGDMYMTLVQNDYTGDVYDMDAARVIYDHKNGKETQIGKSAVLPMCYFDECENGWGYRIGNDGTVEGYVIVDRTGRSITDRTYGNIFFDENDLSVFVGFSNDEEGKIHLLDNNGNILHAWDSTEEAGEVPYEIFDNYVITIDENDLFRVYDRDDFATDGAAYGWYCRLDGTSFTVGDGSYDTASDTPDLIYNADGTVTKTDFNCVIPVRDGKYLVSADYETGIQTVYDRELNVVCTMNEDYYDIYGLEYDDILLAETKDGKFGFVSYDDRVLIPFEYDATMSVVLMQRFSNGNMLVALGYMVDDAYYYDLYLITYHDTVFTDVKNGAWYVDAVRYVYDNGLMNGKTDSIFAPNEEMTRAQLVTVLWRMAGSPEVGYSDRFSDVKESKWFAAPVMWAAENGIVDGFPDGTFAPDQPLTRDQLAAILFRYTELAGGDVSAKGDLSTFTDGGKVQAWARPAVEWAVGEGIISGKPATGGVAVAPKAYATRAEVATVMMRYLSK